MLCPQSSLCCHTDKICYITLAEIWRTDSTDIFKEIFVVTTFPTYERFIELFTEFKQNLECVQSQIFVQYRDSRLITSIERHHGHLHWNMPLSHLYVFTLVNQGKRELVYKINRDIYDVVVIHWYHCLFKRGTETDKFLFVTLSRSKHRVTAMLISVFLFNHLYSLVKESIKNSKWWKNQENL